MSQVAMFAKVVAKSGQREALLKVLLQASRQPMPGCEIYIVNISSAEPDAVFVYELWRTEADHDASLKKDNVKALVAQASR